MCVIQKLQSGIFFLKKTPLTKLMKNVFIFLNFIERQIYFLRSLVASSLLLIFEKSMNVSIYTSHSIRCHNISQNSMSISDNRFTELAEIC